MICPKCRHGLHHFGVDYDRPGIVLVCESCDWTGAEPAIGFVCADCGEHASSEKMQFRDWWSYAISEDGVRALRRGRLPHIHLDDILNGSRSGHGMAEFLALLRHNVQIQRRFSRPLCVVRLTLENLEDLRRSVRAEDIGEVIDGLLGILDETLRETDAMTGQGNTILILMSETDIKQAALPVERLRSEFDELSPDGVQMKAEIFTGDDLHQLLAEAK